MLPSVSRYVSLIVAFLLSSLFSNGHCFGVATSLLFDLGVYLKWLGVVTVGDVVDTVVLTLDFLLLLSVVVGRFCSFSGERLGRVPAPINILILLPCACTVISAFLE